MGRYRVARYNLGIMRERMQGFYFRIAKLYLYRNSCRLCTISLGVDPVASEERRESGFVDGRRGGGTVGIICNLKCDFADLTLSLGTHSFIHSFSHSGSQPTSQSLSPRLTEPDPPAQWTEIMSGVWLGAI